MMTCASCSDSQDLPVTLILLPHLAGAALGVGLIVILTINLAVFIRFCI